MSLRPQTKLLSAASGFVLAMVVCIPARAQNPNLVTDPTFSGQSFDFQTGGSISPDWTYTPDYLYAGGTPWTLVSQTIQTPGDLYIYDINVTFTTTPAMDFFVYWDGAPISLITGADGWDNYNIMATAVSPTSELGFVGTPDAWAALGSVSVTFSGFVDPPDGAPVPVPDRPMGFGLEAGMFAGLFGAAGLYRRQTLRLCRAK